MIFSNFEFMYDRNVNVIHLETLLAKVKHKSCSFYINSISSHSGIEQS